MSNSREKTAEKDPKKLVVCIKTFGCQMNFYDTEVAGGLMAGSGYEVISEEWKRGPNGRKSEPAADVVLMNTCSVREHAEERVYGRLGMLGKAKKKNPDLVIGLMGCMVEEHKEKLFQRFPQLDLMVGTRNLSELPALVEEVRKTRRQVSRIKQEGISIEYTDLIRREGKFHAWLPIMTGCNKVCTFCIVPITRGTEVSMPAREVYREAARLVADGVKWITLLGQNVNSYKGAGGTGEGDRFPELLEMLCGIEGLERISFTTSHPHDATPELYEVIARQPKISRRFHLPLQSGSDRILKRMKRLHTYAEFEEKIRRMREMIPGVVITTDIITGFSGETEEDHAATRKALETLRFDGAYIYKYSVRPGTPAAKLEDDVPMPVKEARNAELLGIQKKIEAQKHQALLGKVLEVFVAGPSPKNAGELRGRSAEERIAIFPGAPEQIGSFVRVKLTGVFHETFRAEIC